MTTKIEAAYRALHEALLAWAQSCDVVPDAVHRNESVRDLLSAGRAGSPAYLNLLDDTGVLDAELIGGPDDLQEFELEQPAILEVVLVEPDRAKRDARFDAIMAALRDFFQSLDDTLGGAVDNVYIRTPPRRMVLRGEVAVKAATIRIDMLLSVPTVFG